MTDTTVPIPAHRIDAVTESLLLLYGSTAEATYKTIQHDDLTVVRLDLRAHRWRLTHLGRLIDRLERSAGRTDVELSSHGERQLLAEALHAVLCDDAEALGVASQQWLHGDDPGDLHARHAAVANALSMIDSLGPPPQVVPVSLPDDVAEMVQHTVDRTGYRAETIVGAALDWRIASLGLGTLRTHGSHTSCAIREEIS